MRIDENSGGANGSIAASPEALGASVFQAASPVSLSPLTFILGRGDLRAQLQMLEVEKVAHLLDAYDSGSESPPEEEAWMSAFSDYFSEQKAAHARGERQQWDLEHPYGEWMEHREREHLIRLLSTAEAREGYLRRVRADDPGDGSLILEAEKMIAEAISQDIESRGMDE